MDTNAITENQWIELPGGRWLSFDGLQITIFSAAGLEIQFVSIVARYML